MKLALFVRTNYANWRLNNSDDYLFGQVGVAPADPADLSFFPHEVIGVNCEDPYGDPQIPQIIAWTGN